LPPLPPLYVSKCIIFCYLRFVTVETFRKEEKMPKSLMKVSVLLKSFLTWTCLAKRGNQSKVAHAVSASKKDAGSSGQAIDIASAEPETEIENKQNLKKEEEDKKKREKEEFSSYLAVLNYMALFVLFLIVFSCDLFFWVSIGTYN
jgi:hypothetical protein